MPKLVTFGELRELGVVYSRTHVYRLMAAGKFPKSVQLGDRRIAWVEAEVKRWVSKKIRERKL